MGEGAHPAVKMNEPLEFHPSEPLTVGVELELQLIHHRDGDLTRAATDLVRITRTRHPQLDIKLEITESMIEVATGIQRDYAGVLNDLRALRDAVCDSARLLNVGVCGGGAHPYQSWTERQIVAAPRMNHISDLYGYLAKQFTVFGQHVHVGCPDGDSAIRLVHGLSRYIPHFIALAASSPFLQGIDTAFDCARMNTVASFPLSGRMPFVQNWRQFADYFEKMRSTGIVHSMKDFYWDIRPKPEYGTVEVRVFDTPLSIARAAALAIYVQSVARLVLERADSPITEDLYLVYSFNRFQACRFGLRGEIVDPDTRERVRLDQDIRAMIARIRAELPQLPGSALNDLEFCVDRGNDSTWIRAELARVGSFGVLMEALTDRFLHD
jgi:glutamate---cysteine ligase / carboxylate-amine ligase